jgi:4-amino-4-deoxy-L-arabinose transferase-like glycosyltransferase
LLYGGTTPIFEAPDEHHHFFAIKTIVDTGNLPSTIDGISTLAGQESAQPPLYYILAALLIKPIDISAAERDLWPNPQVRMGDAGSLNNVNAFVHTSKEDWPWGGYVLAAHLVRIFSSLLGLGTLLLIFKSARLIWPSDPTISLLALLLAAFLPQFLFVHSSISNDSLIIFFSSLVLWQLLRMWIKGIGFWGVLFLGITVGLAVLSKMSGLLLLAFSLLFIMVLILRDTWNNPLTAVRRSLSYASIFIASFILISGWLFLRNWNLYGDPTATNEFIRLAGGGKSFTLMEALRNSINLWPSAIAVFGWMNVSPPGWLYWIWGAVILMAVSGGVYQLIGNRKIASIQGPDLISDNNQLLALLLSLWLIMVYVGLVIFTLRTPAAQGRLLFPALLPMVLWVAYGLRMLRSRWIFTFIGLALLATSLYVLLVTIPDSYTPPLGLAIADLPEQASPVNVNLGQGLELVAVQLETETLNPGDTLWMTLYWMGSNDPSDFPNQQSPQYVLELLGRENTLVGKIQGYHGGGLYPASLWTPGMIIPDRLGVNLHNDLAVPVLIRLNLKLAGEGSSIDVGTVKVEPLKWLGYSDSVQADLNGIQLVEARLVDNPVVPGEDILINVQWQVIIPPGRELTTFVHLGDPREQPLSQGDSPPLGGYYPTSLWDDGDVISDSYTLSIPLDLQPGRYPIYIGMYDPVTGLRQTLTVDGQRQLNDAYLVGWITVEPSPQ